jgi:hypothetical protein
MTVFSTPSSWCLLMTVLRHTRLLLLDGRRAIAIAVIVPMTFASRYAGAERTNANPDVVRHGGDREGADSACTHRNFFIMSRFLEGNGRSLNLVGTGTRAVRWRARDSLAAIFAVELRFGLGGKYADGATALDQVVEECLGGGGRVSYCAFLLCSMAGI